MCVPVSSEGRTFIIALLGCGWPPNKSWKWSDVDVLTDYGKENYHYVRAEMDTSALTPVRITEGTQETAGLSCEAGTVRILLRDDENVDIVQNIVTQTQAPVFAGQTAGSVVYMVGDTVLYKYPVVFKESIPMTGIGFYFEKVFSTFLG